MATNKTPADRFKELEALLVEADNIKSPIWAGQLRLRIESFRECMELQAANEPDWAAMFAEAGYVVLQSDLEGEGGLETEWYGFLKWITEKSAANAPTQLKLTDEEIIAASLNAYDEAGCPVTNITRTIADAQLAKATEVYRRLVTAAEQRDRADRIRNAWFVDDELALAAFAREDNLLHLTAVVYVDEIQESAKTELRDALAGIQEGE